MNLNPFVIIPGNAPLFTLFPVKLFPKFFLNISKFSNFAYNALFLKTSLGFPLLW